MFFSKKCVIPIKHSHKNEDGYSYERISFYSSGRFIIIHDELCYRDIIQAGLYTRNGDSIALKYFKVLNSYAKIEKTLSVDNQSSVSIKVYSAKDSTFLNDINVFARADKREYFDTVAIIANGKISFVLPEKIALRYLILDSDIHSGYSYETSDTTIYDYDFEVYLNNHALIDPNYVGPFSIQQTIMARRKTLVWNNKVFTKE